jgi:hypothetical protein
MLAAYFFQTYVFLHFKLLAASQIIDCLSLFLFPDFLN